MESFPIVMKDSVESISTTKDLITLLESLGLYGDVQRLQSRRRRTGRSALRGRSKKTGKSILFVTANDAVLSRACGALHGVECKKASHISVLDVAPGAEPARLTIYSESALSVLSGMDSTHLRIMEAVQ